MQTIAELSLLSCQRQKSKVLKRTISRTYGHHNFKTTRRQLRSQGIWLPINLLNCLWSQWNHCQIISHWNQISAMIPNNESINKNKASVELLTIIQNRKYRDIPRKDIQQAQKFGEVRLPLWTLWFSRYASGHTHILKLRIRTEEWRVSMHCLTGHVHIFAAAVTDDVVGFTLSQTLRLYVVVRRLTYSERARHFHNL